MPAKGKSSRRKAARKASSRHGGQANKPARAVSKRKQAEEALRESEEHFRSVFESSMSGMYRTTPDGRVLMANPAFAHMLGYASVEEILKHNLEKDGNWAEYERSVFRTRLEKEGKIVGLEAKWTRKNGATLFVRESAIAVYDQKG